MTESVENSVFEHLQHIRAKVAHIASDMDA